MLYEPQSVLRAAEAAAEVEGAGMPDVSDAADGDTASAAGTASGGGGNEQEKALAKAMAAAAAGEGGESSSAAAESKAAAKVELKTETEGRKLFESKVKDSMLPTERLANELSLIKQMVRVSVDFVSLADPVVVIGLTGDSVLRTHQGYLPKLRSGGPQRGTDYGSPAFSLAYLLSCVRQSAFSALHSDSMNRREFWILVRDCHLTNKYRQSPSHAVFLVHCCCLAGASRTPMWTAFSCKW